MNSAYLNDLFAHRFTFLYLVRVNLQLRYQRTALGFVWTLLNPLVTMAITAIVFSMVFRMEVKGYAVFLIAGTLPWLCFSSTLLQSVTVFIHNEGLIKKVYVPKLIFPTAVAASVLVDSLLSAVALLAILIVLGAKISVHLLFLPAAYLLLFPFALAVGLVASIVTVYIRDLQYIMNHLLQLAYFLTPILYPLDMIPQKFHALYALNPMVFYVELFRAPIYRNAWPEPATVAIAALIGAVLLVMSVSFFRRYEDHLVFRL
ncbi:MAG: ABC transporter permease [Burkholderiales bacterium]